MTFLRMENLDLNNKRVLIRVDFNVPIEDGKITSDVRIQACLPTIEMALKQNAKVMLMSHLGRPTEGQYDDASSLAPIATHLSKLIKQPVRLEKDWLDGFEINSGEVVLCENVRFNVGEKRSDAVLAKKMAALCDMFVMDAFGTAHRAEASTYGVAEYAPIACAGPLLCAELDALTKALDNPKRPLVAIVGGSKVSTKLTVLNTLCDKVDQLIVGGGIMNTFLAAEGCEMGKSLFEPDLISQAKDLIQNIQERGGDIPLATDVRVATAFDKTAPATIKNADDLNSDDMIMDIGPETEAKLAALLQNAGTILWNGPVGVFEFPNFANGTKAIGNAIAASSAFSIAGGGDTVAAVDQFGLKDKISYISTGGGAFLEFLEGKELPAVAILKEHAK